jgi:hypothetical protein
LEPPARGQESRGRARASNGGLEDSQIRIDAAKSLGIVYATSASEAINQAIKERRAPESDRFRLVAERS